MPGMSPAAPAYAPPPPPPAANPSKPKEWTPAQYGGYVPPADGKGGGQVLIKSVNGKVVITPIPGTGDNPPLSSSSSTPASNTAPDVKKTTPVVAPAVKPPSAASADKKQAFVAKTNGCVNGDNVISNGNNNNEVAKENISMNGNNIKENQVKKAGKQKSPEMEDLNSIFDPRNSDEMDAADREIEQFKMFCRDSVPVQNRTKISFDVKNIAFKKKM